MDQYLIGQTVHVTITFTNTATGTLGDPSSVTFKYINPQTNIQTNIVYPTGVVRDGIGSYHYDLPASAPGMWWTRFEGTGGYAGAAEYRFECTATRFS